MNHLIKEEEISQSKMKTCGRYAEEGSQMNTINSTPLHSNYHFFPLHYLTEETIHYFLRLPWCIIEYHWSR